MSDDTTTVTPRHVVVSTMNKSVWYGETVESGREDTIELKNARNVIYWNSETKGFAGLAINGPQPGSRISEKVSRIILRNVCGVEDCSDVAVKAFEETGW